MVEALGINLMKYNNIKRWKDLTLQNFLNVLPTSNKIKKVRDNSYLTNCVSLGHEDKNPSMIISQGNKQVVFKCFAGCKQEALLDYFRSALGGK